MSVAIDTVGLREAKNRFSELTTLVNATGKSLTVTKNNKPWVIIEPADAQASERRARYKRLMALTQRIETEPLGNSAWNETASDKELLDQERVRRFG